METVKKVARFAPLALLAMLGCFFLGAPSWGADSEKRLFDREKLQVSTGTAKVTIASATTGSWTSFNPILTIAPDAGHALQTTKVVIDLQKATNGFNALYQAQTIQFTVSRKVDGTNWRQAVNLVTTAVSGTNAVGQSIELDLGVVGPDEQVRIELKVSATTLDFFLPYVVYYRSGSRATLTASS